MTAVLPTLRVITLALSRSRAAPSVAVAELEMRPGFGIVGERHSGPTRMRSTGQVVPNLRQFTAVTPQELGAAAERLGAPYIDPLWLSANLCLASHEVSNMTTALVAGTRLLDSAGRAILRIEGVTEPCLEAGAIVAAQFPHLGLQAQAFPRAAYNRRGVYGVALIETTIKVGDTLAVQLPAS